MMMMMLQLVVAVAAVTVVTVASAQVAQGLDDSQYWDRWRQNELSKVPDMALLHAPYTPYHNDTNRCALLLACHSLLVCSDRLSAISKDLTDLC